MMSETTTPMVYLRDIQKMTDPRLKQMPAIQRRIKHWRAHSVSDKKSKKTSWEEDTIQEPCELARSTVYMSQMRETNMLINIRKNSPTKTQKERNFEELVGGKRKSVHASRNLATLAKSGDTNANHKGIYHILTTNMGYDDIVLKPHRFGQNEMVLSQIYNNESLTREREKKRVVDKWISSLEWEDRVQIHKDKVVFPQPRLLTAKEINKDVQTAYGTGRHRRLRPGEEASIVSAIESILQEPALLNPDILSDKIQTTQERILKKACLEDLYDYPTCMKQIEGHWKIMLTQMRCSTIMDDPEIYHRLINNFVLAEQRGLLINLTQKNNKLVDYLLRDSELKKREHLLD